MLDSEAVDFGRRLTTVLERARDSRTADVPNLEAYEPVISAIMESPKDAFRADTISRKRRALARAGIDVAEDAGDPAVDDQLATDFEQTIGTPDFLPSAWLERGARIMDAVGRIEAKGQTATGFLVSPCLVLTNNHVLKSKTTATGAFIRFRYRQSYEPLGDILVELDPSACFVTSTRLDYALVAIKDPGSRQPSYRLPVIPLRDEAVTTLIGKPLNIIQHPREHQQISVRNNLMVDPTPKLSGSFIIYKTDTEVGSSGSPVLNDRWELVALHSKGHQRRDADGRAIDIQGRLSTARTPKADRDYIANQGTKITSIASHLRKQLKKPTALTGRELVQEALDLGVIE